jgi:hypothetical protein
VALKFDCTLFLLTDASADRIVTALLNDGMAVEPGGARGILVFKGEVSSICVINVTPKRDVDSFTTGSQMSTYLGKVLKELEVPHFGGIIKEPDSTMILHGYMPKSKLKPKKPKNPLDNVYPIRDKNDEEPRHDA